MTGYKFMNPPFFQDILVRFGTTMRGPLPQNRMRPPYTLASPVPPWDRFPRAEPIVENGWICCSS